MLGIKSLMPVIGKGCEGRCQSVTNAAKGEVTMRTVRIEPYMLWIEACFKTMASVDYWRRSPS